MAKVHEIDATEFDTEVLASDLPYLVDLWAPWCGPCVMVAPIVEKIAERYTGKIKVGKLNVDEAPQIAMKYGVRAIPTFLIFKDGEVAERGIGLQPEEELATVVDRVL